MKGLLSREVYENFASAIDDRAGRGEKVQASFVGIEKADIKGAELAKDEAELEKEMDDFKKSIEDEYGPININLTDGTYEVIPTDKK